MARSSLLADGIAAEVSERSEDIERLCPDVFSDGFDVVTDAADADHAIALLRHLWPDEVELTPDVAEHCPACRSTDIAALPRLRLFLLLAAVLITAGAVVDQRDLFLLATAIVGAALIVTPNRRCRSCGERWRHDWK